MKRWHEEKHIAERKQKKYLAWLGSYAWHQMYRKHLQVGRYRKHHPFDCGRSQCSGCHSDKFPVRELTWQEKFADLKLKEYLED